MAININNLGGSRSASLETGRSQDKGNSVNEKSAARTGGAQAAQDTVLLTDQAKELGRIEQGLKSATPDNSAKIEALRQAVADGSYQVDPALVAKKMGDFEQQMNEGN